MDSKLLFSQDVNHKWQRTRYGGFGYAHILRDVVPMLESHGLDGSVLDRILIENPRRMLTFDAPA